MKAYRIIPLLALLFMGVSTVEAKKVTLRYILSPGEKYTIETTTLSEIAQDVMGDQQTMTSKMVYAYDFEVKQVTDQGDFRVAGKLTRIAVESDNPFGKMEFDTDSGQDPPEWAADLLWSLNEPFEFTISPVGKVSDLIVSDQLKAKFEEVTESGSMQNQLMSGMNNSLQSESGWLQMVQNLFLQFPEKPIRKGKSWEREETVNQMVSFDTQTEITLTRSNSKGNELHLESQFTQGDDAKPIEMEGMLMEYDLNGAREGTMLLCKDTGIVLESTSINSVQGIISIDSPQLPNPMTIPMTVKTTETVVRK